MHDEHFDYTDIHIRTSFQYIPGRLSVSHREYQGHQLESTCPQQDYRIYHHMSSGRREIACLRNETLSLIVHNIQSLTYPSWHLQILILGPSELSLFYSERISWIIGPRRMKKMKVKTMPIQQPHPRLHHTCSVCFSDKPSFSMIDDLSAGMWIWWWLSLRGLRVWRQEEEVRNIKQTFQTSLRWMLKLENLRVVLLHPASSLYHVSIGTVHKEKPRKEKSYGK